MNLKELMLNYLRERDSAPRKKSLVSHSSVKVLVFCSSMMQTTISISV